MEALVAYNDILLLSVQVDFKRGLYDAINWKQRMIGIRGTRGVGKTTLLLQKQRELGGVGLTSLYVSLDHPYFYKNSLFDLANEFYLNGGKYLLIDEVHKYGNWSNELKTIYDGFPKLKVVFTSSSALDVFRGEADLSRRVITYELPGMSFREYLVLHHGFEYGAVAWKDLVKDHHDYASEIVSKLKTPVLPAFRQYLRTGYLPLALEETDATYPIKMNQIINAILDTDMAYADSYTPATALRLKKLLSLLAESVPFQPNISELARKLGISRDSIYSYLKALEKAMLIRSLHAKGAGISLLQKPEKLYLENTNLSYALNQTPDKGNLRETFVLNQLASSGKQVHYPKQGDFLVDGYTLEVGGRGKTSEQIAKLPKGIVVADDILTGSKNRIPLWLLGFLY